MQGIEAWSEHARIGMDWGLERACTHQNGIQGPGVSMHASEWGIETWSEHAEWAQEPTREGKRQEGWQ